MTSQSRKSKGRILQQTVCKDLLSMVYTDLEPDDVTSRSMGVNGTDVVLTPAARRKLNLAIECKNVEALNVPTVFWEHYGKYKDESLKLLVHKRNRTDELVTLRWVDFLAFLKERADGKEQK